MSLASELKEAMLGPLLRINIETVVAEAISEHHSDMEQLNRSQLAAGVTADGSEIRPFYKPITVRIKKMKGQSTDKVTLKDTGSFYRGIRATAVGRSATELTSTDGKTDDLVEKYGASIFGLSVASREQLAVRLTPTIQDKFQQALR